MYPIGGNLIISSLLSGFKGTAYNIKMLLTTNTLMELKLVYNILIWVVYKVILSCLLINKHQKETKKDDKELA